jgi:hypothetical protein
LLLIEIRCYNAARPIVPFMEVSMSSRSSRLLALSIIALMLLFLAACGTAATPAANPLQNAQSTGAAQIATLTTQQTASPVPATATRTPTPTITPTAAPSLDDQIAGAWEAGDWRAVLEFLKQKKPVDPEKFYAAYYNYCQQLLKQGKTADAIQACQFALSYNPTGAEARAALIALTPTPTKSPPTATRPPAPTPTSTPVIVSVPTTPPSSGVRVGAVCRDGTTSTATGSGACSHHGGVAYWLYR